MKAQICNNCGRTLGLLEKGHLYEDKVVCGVCIKLLSPDTVRPMTAENTEDVRYERAKRRVVFFLSGAITVFWFVIWLNIILLVGFLVAVIVGFGA